MNMVTQEIESKTEGESRKVGADKRFCTLEAKASAKLFLLWLFGLPGNFGAEGP
jgi:hypothetical protein